MPLRSVALPSLEGAKVQFILLFFGVESVEIAYNKFSKLLKIGILSGNVFINTKTAH